MIPSNSPESSQTLRAVWQPAALRLDEEEALRRYYVLLTDTDLRETYGEQVRAAGQTHQSAVRKVWNRIFLEDGKILIDGTVREFSERAQIAGNIAEFLSETLQPMFETRYSQHPFFARNLGINEVSTLVSEHFSGAKPTLPEAQELAKTFALPLGLVTLHGNNYILNSDEKRLSHPFVRDVMSLVSKAGGETVSLKDIYRMLKREPLGLVHESVHLVLAALVAQRHLEFVTKKGDRINRRSLDLQIIWDDIIGVATPSTVLYGSAKLTGWARTLTANETFKTIDDPDDRARIREALEIWLKNWLDARILERFEDLPAEILTTRIWRLESVVEKTFGRVAQTVEAALDESISLEECLQRIADAFSDSEQEFVNATKALATLRDFIDGIGERKRVWEYLAVCETTEDVQIEHLRENILQIVNEMTNAPDRALNEKLEQLWQEFHPKYSENFSIKHYAVMKSHHLQEKFEEICIATNGGNLKIYRTFRFFKKLIGVRHRF
jgi:hypothetical protein